MTAFLLDTHTFLWALKDSENLSSEARKRLSGSSPQCILSLGSIWELSIKLGLGKLTLPESLGSCLTPPGDLGSASCPSKSTTCCGSSICPPITGIPSTGC